MTDQKYTITFPKDIEINLINNYGSEWTHTFTLKISHEEIEADGIYGKEIEKKFELKISNDLESIEIKEKYL